MKRTARSYREEIVTKTSTLVAQQINGDKVEQWLATGTDEEYLETAVLLQNICNDTPYVQYIYVYQIKPDGCHVVFDIETTSDELLKYDELPDISTDTLGELIDFDESFSDMIPVLLSGGDIDVIESNDTYGWLLTKYEPIYDSEGRCVAYAGVDISMLGLEEFYKDFAKWIILISVVFLGVQLELKGQQFYGLDKYG